MAVCVCVRRCIFDIHTPARRSPSAVCYFPFECWGCFKRQRPRAPWRHAGRARARYGGSPRVRARSAASSRHRTPQRVPPQHHRRGRYRKGRGGGAQATVLAQRRAPSLRLGRAHTPQAEASRQVTGRSQGRSRAQSPRRPRQAAGCGARRARGASRAAAGRRRPASRAQRQACARRRRQRGCLSMAADILSVRDKRQRKRAFPETVLPSSPSRTSTRMWCETAEPGSSSVLASNGTSQSRSCFPASEYVVFAARASNRSFSACSA